jgi:hypothetical protein
MGRRRVNLWIVRGKAVVWTIPLVRVSPSSHRVSAGHTGLSAPLETDVKQILNDRTDTAGRTADVSGRAAGDADGSEGDRHHARHRGAADMRLTRIDVLMIASIVAEALLMGYLAYNGWLPEF